MTKKKLKINKIDLDDLKNTPVITIDKTSEYSLEMFSKKIIKHLTITDLTGNIVHESDINANQFVFNYHANCKDMFILKIKKDKQKRESHIMIL